ncbi:forked protein [Culex quinquefasciatus]|uniref:Forked protein n=1 Tax=Culex quinquefasciatus TaxID=7176 RepID=B0XCF2_CULQU|nr:forked protein [Culex quinquefasciatus]|eukprot:XP_001867324.1 forked protein [Culex quinquefasciatus]
MLLSKAGGGDHLEIFAHATTTTAYYAQNFLQEEKKKTRLIAFNLEKQQQRSLLRPAKIARDPNKKAKLIAGSNGNGGGSALLSPTGSSSNGYGGADQYQPSQQLYQSRSNSALSSSSHAGPNLVNKQLVLPFVPPAFPNGSNADGSNHLIKPSEYLKSISDKKSSCAGSQSRPLGGHFPDYSPLLLLLTPAASYPSGRARVISQVKPRKSRAGKVRGAPPQNGGEREIVGEIVKILKFLNRKMLVSSDTEDYMPLNATITVQSGPEPPKPPPPPPAPPMLNLFATTATGTIGSSKNTSASSAAAGSQTGTAKSNIPPPPPPQDSTIRKQQQPLSAISIQDLNSVQSPRSHSSSNFNVSSDFLAL